MSFSLRKATTSPNFPPPAHLHKTNLYQGAVTSRPSLVGLDPPVNPNGVDIIFVETFPANFAKVLTQQTRKKTATINRYIVDMV